MTYFELMIPGSPETPGAAKTPPKMQQAHILVHYPTTDPAIAYSEKVKERHLRETDKPGAVYYADLSGELIVKAIEDMLFESYMPFRTEQEDTKTVRIGLAPDFINEKTIADLIKGLKQLPGSEARNYKTLEDSFLYGKAPAHNGPLMVH